MFVHFKLKETLILLAPAPESNYARQIHVNVCQDKITPPVSLSPAFACQLTIKTHRGSGVPKSVNIE